MEFIRHHKGQKREVDSCEAMCAVHADNTLSMIHRLVRLKLGLDDQAKVVLLQARKICTSLSLRLVCDDLIVDLLPQLCHQHVHTLTVIFG